MPVNPALLQHAQERRKNWENRVADQITRFAGSMRFVYIHVIWFGSWIIHQGHPRDERGTETTLGGGGDHWPQPQVTPGAHRCRPASAAGSWRD
jgi:hypothetical protein